MIAPFPLFRIVIAARRRAEETMASFDSVVAPIVDRTVRCERQREVLKTVLRAWAVKGGHVVASYAEMVGIPFPVDVCVAGASFARIYDDLLDDSGRVDLADRVGRLLDGGEFNPADDIEAAMLAIYRETDRLLARDRSDSIYTASRNLHAYQTRSLRQRCGGMTPEEVWETTTGKGGWSLVVLFGFARAAMPADEQAFVYELGATMQLVDDLQDRVVDRRAGRQTPLTDGLPTAETRRLLRGAAGALRQRYGDGPARVFAAELRLYEWFSLAGLFRSWIWSSQGRFVSRRRAPLLVLLARGGSVGASI